MIKILYLLLVSVIFSSCENESIDGHWHFHNHRELVYLENDEFLSEFILDINGDSALWNNDQIMVHNRNEKSLETLNTHRGITKFKYSWNNDTVFITKSGDGNQYYAVRCDMGCCDKQKDAFIEVDLNIDLPILMDTRFTQEQSKKRSLGSNLYLGLPKNNIFNCFPSTRIWNHKGYLFVQDLEIINAKGKIKVPANMRDKMYYQIYADKNVKFEYVREIVAEFERIGINKIYLVVRSDTNLQEVFEPKNIKVTLDDFTNFNQDQSVAEYVESLR